jgi:anti-sigma factor ChrR (cupin superfamily)
VSPTVRDLTTEHSGQQHLARRIGVESVPTSIPLDPGRYREPKWQEAGPGISVKLLSNDLEQDRVSMLVRLTPGTEYLPNHHAGLEELHLLHGELMIGDRKLYTGDYNRAEPGTEDHRVWSETGCTCVLITSVRDALHQWALLFSGSCDVKLRVSRLIGGTAGRWNRA